jgi:hypothetical protein
VVSSALVTGILSLVISRERSAMNRLSLNIAVFLSVVLSAIGARAGNVDLSTVPKRDSIQLTIYNSEDLTLVRETRVVTFKKGANPGRTR